MVNFFYKHRHKLILIALCAFLAVGLSSCRWDSSTWYVKAYTSYGQEWIDLWDGGKGFWNTLWAWPINLLSWPIAWLCSTIGKGIGNSYFWGILFTTLIVRTLAWPIYSRQNSSSLKMQLMQPEMAKIQAKYQNRKDQRSQQMMQQEMMKLYKKHGMNPLGCLGTMFLQFPIFMAMYEVVQRINATTTVVVNNAVSYTYSGAFALTNTKVFGLFEMNTSFFQATMWYDKVFAAVVAVLFVAMTILSQKLSQRPQKYQKIHPQDKNKQADQGKQMKYMMVIMNVMFGFMALSNTSLGIYWLIGSIYQLFQSQVGRWINAYKWEKAQKQNNIID
ncbi:YidC/Oxa1 family membrane protein insertase [Anaeroplasma bactoclasticum]|jgi:YidC/Oxa1 family membrane protein insertase|uniref:YidC/Oxa1 family membrane protein insertase n=1 Tax=Anaeroplasma bactoclasticum TaxID=2088 RepID=A0A397RS55_9MOLU|nr:YidC/Oxa1 family membrane protein insertase [Anaeroplasma bactoclasticum]RIA75546.1 YidC/Oxa1 family membrane protein insertase [Anaeroplasma bactoclasticum]